MLAYAYGAVLILIGLDKAFGTNIITDWVKYVSPLAQSVLPVPPATIVLVLGIAEIIVGIIFFTRWVRIAAFISILVLIVIIINLFSLGLYDIAARDALIALGAFAAAQLAATQGYTWGGRTR